MKAKLNLLLVTLLLLCASLPARAQDVAFESAAAMPIGAIATGASSGAASLAIHPQQVSGSADHDSNMQHWSRFSQSGRTSSAFVRVPAGTKRGKANVSHYIHTQCVEPSTVRVATQAQKGPVKHYLAFNVPTATPVRGSASKAAHAKKQQEPAKKIAMCMGYGKKGEVIYKPIAPSRWSASRTAISCYGRYQ